MSAPALSGVLSVDKAPGITSFDVVARVRKRLGIRRVGHAGTLDPSATGVLPLLLGEATKLMPYLVDQDKEYVATVRFGISTDTHDATGRILGEHPVPPLTVGELERACRPFVGRIQQAPPMYSAVHHEGKRLYELARAGIAVDRTPREVVVHALSVEAVFDGRATLRVVCGKGTYVRVLAADLGAALGCGAVVERLVRQRVGALTLADAVSWAELNEASREALVARIEPVERALAGWREVRLDRWRAGPFVHGQAVEIAPVPGDPAGLVRVHDASGAMIGVGELRDAGRRVRPVRILHADRPGARLLPG